MSFYKLRNRVGCCRSGDRFVFLDLEADRYFCLGRELEQAFAALVSDQPVDAQAIAALSHAGVIIGADEGRPALCTTLPAQAAHLSDLAAAHLKVFTSLLHRAKWAVRVKTRTFVANIDWLVDRRTRGEAAAAERAEVASLVAGYRQARLWWSEQGHCLSTSLALMEDLISRGFAPNLVFAVRLGPFEAHCWVELEGLLVNETPERVRPFTPVMVI
ncbi:lasso peptide biosynthesis B2 protein [Novosphingobium sp. M1R2S20]|uniref:Lasso peptide biosynthesis B2 protein n=1 Tax=Novosphingobium rhizovicinum TaxID=3228928 RepID=A0ABV3RF06_9SPHN